MNGGGAHCSEKLHLNSCSIEPSLHMSQGNTTITPSEQTPGKFGKSRVSQFRAPEELAAQFSAFVFSGSNGLFALVVPRMTTCLGPRAFNQTGLLGGICVSRITRIVPEAQSQRSPNRPAAFTDSSIPIGLSAVICLDTDCCSFLNVLSVGVETSRSYGQTAGRIAYIRTCRKYRLGRERDLRFVATGIHRVWQEDPYTVWSLRRATAP